MSVKVIKTEQTKTWVTDTIKGINRTISNGVVDFDLNLLPKEVRETIYRQTTTGINLIPLALGGTEEFDRQTNSRRIWKKDIPKEIKEYLEKLIHSVSLIDGKSNTKPIRIPLSSGDVWAFNGFLYKVEYKNQIRHSLSDEELLVMKEYSKERKEFDYLKNRFTNQDQESLRRERIPERVRIEVWRRDEGKCARCGSREKLEYDHIVPVSKGGSNTARNIELLCESCNRKKSNNIA